MDPLIVKQWTPNKADKITPPSNYRWVRFHKRPGVMVLSVDDIAEIKAAHRGGRRVLVTANVNPDMFVEITGWELDVEGD